MNYEPLVSIIINNYNYGRFLPAAIASALQQSYPHCEVIVVDDGSTDDSRAVLADFGARITTVLQANAGQAAALNAGFARCRGAIVLFLDADDMLLPDAVQHIVAAFARNPEAAKVMLRMAVIDAAGELTGEIKPAAHLPLVEGDLRQEVLAFAADVPWMPTSANAFAAATLRRMLPIPAADYGRVGADWYLAQVSPLFGPVVFLDLIGAHYRVHGANHYATADAAIDLAQVRQSVHFAETTRAHIQAHAEQLALAPARPAPAGAAVSTLANRLILLRLDPARRAALGCRLQLARQGCTAARRRFDASAAQRLLFCTWFLAMALAPRFLAVWLAHQFLHPQRRPLPLKFSRQLSMLVFLGLALWQMPAAQNTEKSIWWGALIDGGTYGRQDAPWDMRSVELFEESAGKRISILHWGQAWWHCYNTCDYQHFRYQQPQYEKIRRRGIIPFVDWASWASNAKPMAEQPQFALQTIIDGKHDAYIRQWATEAAAWGYPFFLRFNWEMNGDWFPWSEKVNNNQPGQYVQAWRHVHDIFEEVGADNVTWVWCPNVVYPGSIPLKSLYPGDAYVDWSCMDGYNWGQHPTKPDRWKSFDELFSPTYAELLKLNRDKPIIIGETASSEIGGSKPEWITAALTEDLPNKFPRVEAVLWFNWDIDGMDWVIESSSASRTAFAAAIAADYYSDSGGDLVAGVPIQPGSRLPLLCLYSVCLFLPQIITP
jgi:CTP:molybdopterin cytidylyltransferase MocA